MERRAWLDERRAAVEEDYTRTADTYDAGDIRITPTHRRFVTRLLDTCPPDGTVLDAPCGTGKYFGLVRDAGRQVVGIDQSAGMLAQAEARGLATRLEKVGLQELSFVGQFDGSMTVDAMENVGPEDWPLVLSNLHRAVRPGGHLYFTVEEIDDAEIDAAFAELSRRGLPVVRGEVIEGDVAGYHYYPGRERVERWLADEGLIVVEDGYNQEDGWGYRHFLVRDATGQPGLPA
ncbi:MAG TPA: methyltransferase domain-containing protein [Candidatus Limnocylindrales bacterium]|jgi:SAM-dependent methyltransferase|nr:methyltransferase domain-containing protein [Candidatus Limnocylindrales bacterium]